MCLVSPTSPRSEYTRLKENECNNSIPEQSSNIIEALTVLLPALTYIYPFRALGNLNQFTITNDLRQRVMIDYPSAFIEQIAVPLGKRQLGSGEEVKPFRLVGVGGQFIEMDQSRKLWFIGEMRKFGVSRVDSSQVDHAV